jgi:hypothetical protein
VSQRLTIAVMQDSYAVCRLAADAAVPSWGDRGRFSSVTRTPDELSIVCDAAAVPDGVRVETGWRVLAVQGPLDFWLTGVLASLTAPLAEAEISIFAMSTFDTDYVLVRDADLERASAALRAAGHSVSYP